MLITNQNKNFYKNIESIRNGILLYFFLLIFEGALRRWVLPGFSDLLLIVRDPIALFILYQAWRNHLLVFNGYLITFFAIALISFFTAILIGHGNWIVALYGVRIIFIHVPLVFIIGTLYDSNDVMKIVRWMIMLSIPMTLLIVIQFYSPQTSLINIGLAGNTEGGGFSGALGYFRPPGTFSFILGVSLFYGFASCFIFYALLNPVGLSNFTIYCGLIAVLFSIPYSISRTLLFSILLSYIFFLTTIYSNRKLFWRMLLISIFLIVTFILLSTSSLLSTGVEVFNSRFSDANENEGGLISGVIGNRFFGGLYAAIVTADQRPIWGLGVGMGTNAGAKILTGSSDFLISEGEWGRIIGEIGPLLGILFILLRVLITTSLGVRSFRELKFGNSFSWILFSNVLITFSQAQWAQPTALGFSVFFAGILLASLKKQH
jgi:hypothetical protein